jgi:hypothetical protein
MKYIKLTAGCKTHRLKERRKQCFHLQGFFLAARKYWSLQGIYKEIKFTRKWQGKIHKLKEIARISVTYTNYKS